MWWRANGFFVLPEALYYCIINIVAHFERSQFGRETALIPEDQWRVDDISLPCYAVAMSDEKHAPKPDDIELVPDAWDRFVEAVKQVAKHPPVEHPTGYGKTPKPKRRRLTRRP
jgi:hypothetical protein